MTPTTHPQYSNNTRTTKPTWKPRGPPDHQADTHNTATAHPQETYYLPAVPLPSAAQPHTTPRTHMSFLLICGPSTSVILSCSIFFLLPSCVSKKGARTITNDVFFLRLGSSLCERLIFEDTNPQTSVRETGSNTTRSCNSLLFSAFFKFSIFSQTSSNFQQTVSPSVS